jgi:hypothetical protein
MFTIVYYKDILFLYYTIQDFRLSLPSVVYCLILLMKAGYEDFLDTVTESIMTKALWTEISVNQSLL